MKTVIIWCGVVLALACSPRGGDLARMTPTGSAIDAVYGVARERVWSEINLSMAERGIEVKVADSERGVIATEFTYASDVEDELACTGFATSPGARVDAVRYRLHFRVIASGPRSTVVRLYADVQVQVSSDGSEGAWIDCASTGQVERIVLDAIDVRIARAAVETQR